jgi:hypothetical protein
VSASSLWSATGIVVTPSEADLGQRLLLGEVCGERYKSRETPEKATPRDARVRGRIAGSDSETEPRE